MANEPGQDDKPSAVDHVKHLTTKGIGGWWEGLADRWITWILLAIAPSGGWAAWFGTFLASRGIPMSEAIIIGIATAIPIVMVVAYARTGRATRKILTRLERLLADGSSGLSPIHRSGEVLLKVHDRDQRPIDLCLRAIGILDSFYVQYQDFGGLKRFKCGVWVNFSNFSPCQPSPLSLILRSGTHEICKLELSNQRSQECPVSLQYFGEGDWHVLMAAIGTTMGPELRALGYSGADPWTIWPPSVTLYCDLEVHLPIGAAAEAHGKSRIKLQFELEQQSGLTFRCFIHATPNFISGQELSITTL